MSELINESKDNDQAQEQDFDEAWYLQTYGDVAASVARGGWKSGYHHFDKVGRERGRFRSAAHQATRLADQRLVRSGPSLDTPSVTPGQSAVTDSLDVGFYTSAYPLAREELAAGLAATASEHYSKIGKHRGYLPNRAAPRPENPAKYYSRFGGFWTDQANAVDLVKGKLELGRINERQAELLSSFITDGYVVIKNAVPTEILDKAENELILAYHGGIPKLRFNVTGSGRKAPWSPDALARPAKALDIHWLCPAIRDLIFAPALMDLLHLVMERRTFATQTLGFWRGSAQSAHQDSAYVNYSLPMQFLASWIALEDVREDAGELFYYVGSQRMPEYLYIEKFKGVEEATRMTGNSELGEQIQDHVENIPRIAETMGLAKRRFLAKRGDILIWCSDLAHGGSPISADCSRKSIVTHYTTAEAVPSYFELHPGKVRAMYAGEYYSSAHYDFEPKS